MTSTISTTCFGERFALRADWADASSPVESLDIDGEWFDLGKRVADYRHDPKEAILATLRQSVRDSGDDEDGDPSILETIQDALDAAVLHG